MNSNVSQIFYLIGLSLSITSFIAVICVYGRIDEIEDKLNSTKKYLSNHVSFSIEKIVDNAFFTQDLSFRVKKLEKLANMTSVTVDPGKLKVLEKTPGGVIRKEQVPVVHRFYPCVVTHRADSEDFCWNYFSKSNAYFMQGGNLPDGFDEKPCNVSLDCTVEVLEYPDGRYSAAWFPGEFRTETSPDAQNCP